MFKRRKLPPGYTLRAEVVGAYADNYLVLRHVGRIVAGADLDLTSVWFTKRKLRKIAWADYEGRSK